MRRRFLSGAGLAGILCGGALWGFSGLADKGAPRFDHPAILYASRDVHDPVTELSRRLQSGQARLKFEGPQGYLRSVLEALQVPIESQIAVFSKTSLQAALIELGNPRTLFFNDSVVVAWMPGGFIEVASQDPRQGVLFYTLAQRQVSQPIFERRDDCLRCHVSDASLGVPGMIIRSTFTAPDGSLKLIYGDTLVDHRSPMEERWGGYYVTGSAGANRHLGNALVTNPDDLKSMVTPATLNVASLQEKVDTSKLLSPYSDVVALLVFDHQMHMMNLITRLGWESRVGPKASLMEAASELVDYLLFTDEVPMKSGFQSTSGFRAKFESLGPRDGKGRSLRDLDLSSRLPLYPCSYMIYSEAFDGLPSEAKNAVYARMWRVLSGQDRGKKYVRLGLTERRAIIEILRATKAGLPTYFQPVMR